MRERFLHGEAAQVAVTGLPPVVDRLFGAAGALELLRQQLRRAESGKRFSSTAAMAPCSCWRRVRSIVE